MSQYFNVVPWRNSEEWCEIYNKVCSPDAPITEKQELLDSLLVWKARCPSLPSGIESTLSLLDVQLEDAKRGGSIAHHDVVLRLAYSSAIMRFVNHMLDTETAKGASLYQAAKNLDVPDWIIDLRHDTAHSNTLPSLELLRSAASISLQWLRKHYWEKHKEHIRDFIVGEKNNGDGDENKITSLMNFCISLSICANAHSKVKSVADIPDPAMRESVIKDIKDFFGNSVDLSNLKTVSVLTLIDMLQTQSRRLLKGKEVSCYVNKTLLGEDSLFLSLELTNLLGEYNFYAKNFLSKRYMQCFEVLLTYLHSNGLILDFVQELISITQKGEIEDKQCKLAAIWISEIFKALARSKLFIERMNITISDVPVTKNKETLKHLFCHWFPNEKDCRLLLDLVKQVPHQLTDINYVRPILSTYNPYLTFFIKELLDLLEPKLPKATTDRICSLAELISSQDTPSAIVNKIYTLDDLKSAHDQGTATDSEGNSDSSCVMYDDVEMPEEGNKETTLSPRKLSGMWKLAPSSHNWSKCPIGILPWQITSSTQNMEV